jgi:DNA repair exonuclease SbcCD ATPase subunit
MAILPVCLILLLTPAVPATAQTLTADQKELASYTLTMPNVRKTATAIQRFQAIAAKNPKLQQAAKIQAEIDALEQKDTLTAAEEARLEKLQAQAEALDEEIDREVGMNANGSIDEIVARIEREPEAKAVLAREGLTPRDFAKTMLTLLQAAMIKGFSQGGKVDMAKLPPGVNPANIKFVEEHEAELKKLQAALGLGSGG